MSQAHDHSDHEHAEHEHSGRSHSHAHVHAPASYGAAFAFGIGLNSAFVAIEAFYGWRTGSLALLADAAHNLSDIGGLLLAWAAYAASQIRPSHRYTYGWRRASILASFLNAVILLLAMAWLAWEAIERMQIAAAVEQVGTVMLVAGVGVIINGATAWLFLRGSKSDLNIRGAFLHMIADALVSVGVIVAGALYLWQGWTWIDPLASLVIALVVVVGTWSLFQRSLHLLFDGVPEGIEVAEIEKTLLGVSGVVAVHDIHVWALGTSENAVTAHLVLEPMQADCDQLLREVNLILSEKFGIRHSVLQPESLAYAESCTTGSYCRL